MRKRFESGQAIVLVLLSLSVVLTVVLFALSRSVGNIATTTQQSDSVRAFSAAEAGVENALITGAGTNGNSVSIGNASYNVQVISQGVTSYNYNPPLSSGETLTLWFVSHDADGKLVCNAQKPCYTGPSLNVYWGASGTAANLAITPAIEITVYYATDPTAVLAGTSYGSVQVARATFDPNTVRQSSNYFSAAGAGATVDGKSYAFGRTINWSDISTSINSSGLLFAKVRMLYNSVAQPVGFTVGAGTLPSQGLEIVSQGTVNSGTTTSNRSVYVFQSWADFPFSGFSLYYPNGVVSQ